VTEPKGADQHDLVAGYLLDALDEAERDLFLAQIATCAACQEELRRLDPVVADLWALVEIQPSPAVEAALMGELFDESSLPTASDADDPAAHGSSPGSLVGSSHPTVPNAAMGSEQAPARPAVWRRMGLWAAAAAVAFLLGVGAGAAVLNRSSYTPVAQPPMHEVMEISAAKDAHVMPLDVPAGTATLVVSNTMDKGAIVTDDLPMPAADEVYQLWTVMDDGSMQSAASFRPDHQGQAAAVLETGVREAEAFMLTVEEPGMTQPTAPPIATVTT
jgi:hypothetical protein